ncbi:MAG TPA: glycine betaine ABC transporter substrate-binding protein [Deltaproteobacteria bacterium]|nr:glycine betaine ABC transporter substrate-binding protein [Deltaproteobacteria bacterium]
MGRWHELGTVVVLVAAIFAGVASAACGQQEKEKPTVRLAYVEWSSEIASTNLVKVVIEEELGYPCEITAMRADEMWKAVAKGEVDAMVAAWLPSTHAHFYEQYGKRVEDLGPNLEGTRTGLVVPQVAPGRQTARSGLRNEPYITIDSIPEIKEHVDKFRGRIIGIDPEAGIMRQTKKAMKVYGLENMKLISGSEISMTAELAHAIRKLDWVIVTGWVPHWKFARYRLKFLDDPEKVYGGEEAIHTLVREGLKEDMPEIYAFLDNFYWTPEDMEQLMLWIEEQKGVYPEDSARRWMSYHREKVQEWLP